ncbi:MAG: aldo/keto reductase [Bacteroidales bacterium]
MSTRELARMTRQIIEIGITSFDHADIYGDYTCEAIFGKVLAADKSLRKDIQLISKCGIKLLSDKFPDRKIKHYDYSADYIISSAEQSLSNFNTESLDLFLLHRPAPFFDPEEVAKAFSHLKQSGKVRYFGVSNFTPQQFEMLEEYVDQPLVTNQVEISPVCLEHFDNGNMDFFIKRKIHPMAWSPLAGGKLMKPENEKEHRLYNTIKEIASEMNVNSLDKVIYRWLLKHPAQILPIINTGKMNRIKNAVGSMEIPMTLEQWYRIYTASKGVDVP